MLHTGRVGSTVLADMLGRHNQIAACGEVYYQEWERIFQATRFKNYQRPPDPYYPVRRSILKTGKRIPVYEIKFLPTQHLQMVAPDMETMIADLKRLGTRRFIIVERRNILRRAISVQTIINSGQTHQRGIDGAKRSKTVRIDPSAVPLEGPWPPLEQYCDQILSAHERLRSLIADEQVLDLTYEDDIQQDPGNAYRKCCAFLGVEPEEIAPRLERTNPDPAADVIENFEDVAAALRGTRHEWMLAE